MFSRTNRGDAPADPATAPRKPAVASLIAEGVTLRGDFATQGDLHLDGAVEGDLTVGHLCIGETGSVAGTIQAQSVEIRGRVCGAISARQVRLCATARMEGDITHAELSIDAGAHFEGRSLVLAAEPALSVVAAE
ncbi:MAG TPA: polymer-forming cytoskeletal protein [Phenylobacterium sp.]|nr:polymer-forming cytoskeletal protein [Phenylobacterium sp.]